MSTLKISRFKRLAIFILATALFWSAAADWIVPADAADQKPKATAAVTVAQSENQTATQQKTGTPPASQESESQTEEKGESAGSEMKKIKDFRPSEQIEAEQAVDFPYDI